VTSVVYNLEIIAAVITNLDERIDLFADFGMARVVGNLECFYIVVVNAAQEFVEAADLPLHG
jgi:hypothetical protein